ncbi:MAG: FAD:protein FMN transferase [Fibrobacteres bacterium]|nr:FAD:protein FMN transferase [Fibrobacterota bacterium]MBK9575499.1 FAD:protein FMN transferase [Fibrobacterota bacterium]QQS04584.1 MAG: FAD:protein FMN transferase [Fibrobacterota bacterium]
MNRRQFLITLAGAAGAVALAPRWVRREEPDSGELVHHASWIMGQIANIWIQTDRPDQAGEAVSAAFQAMRKVESTLSLFDPSSELRAFLDGKPGRVFRASPVLHRSLENSAREWRHTEGAFDPCAMPGRPSNGPGDFLRAEGGPILPSREASLDFGGIGCGIALDEAGRELRRRGMDRALLELSGDFLALDPPQGWMGWPMVASDPWTGAPSQAGFDLARAGLATSSTVERRSILDPRDGSVAKRLAQATVVAPTATQADAWSTALVVRAAEGIGPRRAEFDYQGRLVLI